jgi:hypothetical protein
MQKSDEPRRLKRAMLKPTFAKDAMRRKGRERCCSEGWRVRVEGLNHKDNNHLEQVCQMAKRKADDHGIRPGVVRLKSDIEDEGRKILRQTVNEQYKWGGGWNGWRRRDRRDYIDLTDRGMRTVIDSSVSSIKGIPETALRSIGSHGSQGGIPASHQSYSDISR